VLGEYLEARRILEIEAAGLAAERATADDLATLADTYARMVETAEQARASRAAEKLYQEADIGFHRDVVRAARNRALASMTEPIHRALNIAFERLARPEARFERGLPEHRRILKGIADRDPDAAREAMAAHLRTVEGYLEAYAKRERKAARKRRRA
jgi:GntR family transcriptional repressor for pyruvate dehydrogenase complex